MMFTAMRKFAVFSGRARRKEYWQFTLLTVLVGIVASMLDSIFNLHRANGSGVLSHGVSAGFLLPSLAVLVRRLHDVGRPGWLVPLWCVLVVVAIVGFVSPQTWVKVLTAVPAVVGALSSVYYSLRNGDVGPNRYGPDPKTPDLAGVFD